MKKTAFYILTFFVVNANSYAQNMIGFEVKDPIKNTKNNDANSADSSKSMFSDEFLDPFAKLNEDMSNAFKSFWGDVDIKGTVDKSFDFMGQKMGDMREKIKVLAAKDPQIMLIEGEKEIKATIFLKGTDVSKDNIDISIKKGLLAVKGEKKVKEETKEKDSEAITESYAMFAKSVLLPKDAKIDDAVINYDEKDKIIITIPR